MTHLPLLIVQFCSNMNLYFYTFVHQIKDHLSYRTTFSGPGGCTFIAGFTVPVLFFSSPLLYWQQIYNNLDMSHILIFPHLCNICCCNILRLCIYCNDWSKILSRSSDGKQQHGGSHKNK